jgi:PhnB protein
LRTQSAITHYLSFGSNSRVHHLGIPSILVYSGVAPTLIVRQYIAMKETTNESHFVPEGWHTLTPRIVARDAKQLVEFLKTVFDASGECRHDRPSVIRIGDSVVMISDAGVRSVMPAFLYVYVIDTDATYRRAVEAGARTVEEPLDTPYGDRRCMVEDKWGNTWQIATYKGEAGRTMG